MRCFKLPIFLGFSFFSALVLGASNGGAKAGPLPQGFVRISEVDPSIVQEIRYAGFHNFIGRPARGYDAPECWLTSEAAQALSKVQQTARKNGMTLKVYDCYRPQRAVQDFVQWAQALSELSMKAEFYPHEDKAKLFADGYIAAKSGHSRGSSVDLTLVPVPVPAQAEFQPGQALVSCTETVGKRFADNSLDMGTGFDCFDSKSHGDSNLVPEAAQKNRKLLSQWMNEQGFQGLKEEWWHFSFKPEPFPTTYFDFPIRGPCPSIIQDSLLGVQQMIMVTSQEWSTTDAKAQLFSRDSDSGDWTAQSEVFESVIGKKGLGWAPAFAAALNGPLEPLGPIKHEGDGKTPAGIFVLGTEFGFSAQSPVAGQKYLPLNANIYCIDDVKSKHYNEIVDASVVNKDWDSGEAMSTIEQYKSGVQILYPTDAESQAGSCIFIHIWRAAHIGTAGCLASTEDNVKMLLQKIDFSKRPVIIFLRKPDREKWSACLPGESHSL
jgi:D-alanyl-D-alanine dipeptidase